MYIGYYKMLYYIYNINWLHISIYIFVFIKDGNTALIGASMNEHEDIACLLLTNTNIDINKQNKVSYNLYAY